MSPKPKTKKPKITKALICLNGKDGDLIVGNGENYNPVYIENGKPFLELLDKIKKDGADSIDQNLLKLLTFHNILATQEPMPKLPPQWIDTCCGRMGEQTISLPLTDKANEQIYSNIIDRLTANIKNSTVLSIRFHGRDPVSDSKNVQDISKIINQKIKSRTDVQLKFHLDSTLEDLPEDLLNWMKQNTVSLSVFLSLPEGLDKKNQKYDNVKNNVQKLLQACVSVSFITPAVSSNVGKLLQIAENYASFNMPCGFEFPAVQNPSHPWNYGSENDLPDADKYSQALVDIYHEKFVEDCLFSPVNELRHRIGAGGYRPGCSCLYDHAAVLEPNGNIYPCLSALNIKRLCLGNITSKPGNQLKHASDEFKNIEKKSAKNRTTWNWRTLCGLHCSLWDNPLSKKYCLQTLENYFYKPRIRLLNEIIWDIFKEKKQESKQ